MAENDAVRILELQTAVDLERYLFRLQKGTEKPENRCLSSFHYCYTCINVSVKILVIVIREEAVSFATIRVLHFMLQCINCSCLTGTVLMNVSSSWDTCIHANQFLWSETMQF